MLFLIKLIFSLQHHHYRIAGLPSPDLPLIKARHINFRIILLGAQYFFYFSD